MFFAPFTSQVGISQFRYFNVERTGFAEVRCRFHEMVVMGVLAVRLQGLNRELLWDGDNMRFKNIGSGDQIAIMIEDGFTIHNGHPTFNKRYTDPINAQQFAAEMIRHNYREGWELPAMPK